MKRSLNEQFPNKRNTMSGRLGPRLKNQSSGLDASVSVGLDFLQTEEKYQSENPQNEWKVKERRQNRKSRPSSSKNAPLNKKCHSDSGPDELKKQSQSEGKKNTSNTHRESSENRSSSHRKHNDEPENRNFKSGLSFTRLQRISLQDSTDIIRSLANSQSGLDEFISGNIKPDHMYLIIKIISKLTASDWEANKQHVLSKVSTPEFFKKITEFVTFLVTDEQNAKRREEMEQFFENLLTYFQAVILMLPSVAADHLQIPLRATKMALANVSEYQNITIRSSLTGKMEELMSDFDQRKKEKEEREIMKQEKKTEFFYPKPLGSISSISIYPRREDIMSSKRKLVPNKIEGPYNNVNHYLDVHFQLLREDFISPLREGIESYRTNSVNNKSQGSKYISHIRIYKKVTFLKPIIMADKVGYNICFDPEKRLRVNWESTKRFIFGSLLIFTTDNFETFFLATVIRRDLNLVEKDRVVSVVLCNTNEVSKQLLSKEFVMAESEVYFEPYYYVLKALQKFDDNTFPMKKYIVYASKNTEHPAYTRNGSDVYAISMGDKGINGRKTFKLFENHNWPTSGQLGFDLSQYQAFKAALTNDLVVIQGPPGTGKTYLGLKIAGALLENSLAWNYDKKSPILVICFTNHALDQFLEGILENGLTNNLIRIGGRSNSEMLESFNLKERRRCAAYFTPSYTQAALLKDLKSEISNIFDTIKVLQGNLSNFDKFEGILSVKTLKIVMNEVQTEFFSTNDDLLSWLLLGVKFRSQENVISSNEKEAESRDCDENICDEYEFDQNDIENLNRVREVLFDSIEFEESDSPNSNNLMDSLRIYYCFNLDDIKKKIEEHDILLQTIPSLEESRNVIQSKMREAKKAHSDLLLIHNHFQGLLKRTQIPLEDDTNRLYSTEDLTSLSLEDRWILYKVWIEFLKAGNWSLLQSLEERFRKGAERYEETRQYNDLRVVQQADVVGVTTTTAARLQAMLRELRPKIVIVEEAAEVLEAHIIASLSAYCQHLILIGDHKQLRPSPADYRIGKDYHLDVSLFERLINNGINFHTLTTQHRMRPEISRLLVPSIYPTLVDHPMTQHRPKILGMDHNIFFMTHNHPEDEVVDIMSKKNTFEARMVMGLARHLLLQGYGPDEITVLATYNGQMHLLKQEQRRQEISQDLRVTVVDNYQGEENKIIILSLVRSNKENKIGFLKTDNRVCVALSRARDGLYIFGNMDCLCAESALWQRIRKTLLEQKSLGPALVLRCETHPRELSRISVEHDWAQVLEGGCSKPCGEMLSCGHLCRSLCHVSKDRHVRYRCSQICNRPMCADGHLCTKKCYENCGKCVLPQRRTLACGHSVELPCCVDHKKFQCKKLVTLTFPGCKHEVKVECYRRDCKQCPEPCIYRLDCGHQCTRTCHESDDPDHLNYLCPKPCVRTPLPQCTTEGHKCRLSCFEECEPCDAVVVKTLPCGHTKTVPCIDTDLSCLLPCELMLPCGHPCKNLCSADCGGCAVKVEKVVPRCGHRVRIACDTVPTKAVCNGQCSETLACGHKCMKRCKETCSELDCVEPTAVSLPLPCGHTGALVPCNMIKKLRSDDGFEKQTLLQYCMEPCLKQLDCSHCCTGTCGQCMQGRIHKVCDEDCNNTLICGHSCPVPCRKVCPPCQKPCQVRCMHTKCPKKCGEPCVPCNEPCESRCPHTRCKKRCGELCDRKPCYEPCFKPLDCSTLECLHPCVGFCGEPCPPCKICHPEPYEPFFYTGEEEEPETKWVLLNDCKHVVDSTNLERWLGMDQEGSEIKLKRCPKCSPTANNRHIVTTQRYMNLVKTTFLDIQLVKKKLFGNVEEIRKEREKLLKQVKDIPFREVNHESEIDEIYYLQHYLEKVLPVVRRERRKDIGIEELNVLDFMVKYLVGMVEMKSKIWTKLNETARKKLLLKMDILTKAIRAREKKISQKEMESFGFEQNRIIRYGDLLMLESSVEYQPLKTKSDVLQCFKTAENLIEQISEYSSKQDEKVVEAIQKLKTLIKSSAEVSAADRQMIHKAMSTSFHRGAGAQGHWFKCPNGHIYVITECGGAMEESVCPERGCGASIGGQHHRYLPNQQLASEMDGAQQPAWSSGYDMNNFDLNNLH